MSERRCDCGADPYYSYEDATRGGHEDITLCESCYIGELEAAAAENIYLRKRVKELEEALKPFSHPAFRRLLGGNVQGDASPIYGREDAILTIGDFKRAAEALEGGKR